MLKDLLRQEDVRILQDARDWRDAVNQSMQTLLDREFITPGYIDTIIRLTDEVGAYYLLLPELALLHARPTDGVNRSGMSLTLLRNPVTFPGKKTPTPLLIGLAAQDTSGHLDALAELGTLLNKDENLQKMIHAETEQELYRIFVPAE